MRCTQSSALVVVCSAGEPPLSDVWNSRKHQKGTRGTCCGYMDSAVEKICSDQKHEIEWSCCRNKDYVFISLFSPQ